MSEHTRGPWTVHEEFTVIDASDEFVAFCRDLLKPDPECVANAYLIASAPEMYETGMALLQALGFPGGRWDMDWPETPQVVAFFDAVHRLHPCKP